MQRLGLRKAPSDNQLDRAQVIVHIRRFAAYLHAARIDIRRIHGVAELFDASINFTYEELRERRAVLLNACRAVQQQEIANEERIQMITEITEWVAAAVLVAAISVGVYFRVQIGERIRAMLQRDEIADEITEVIHDTELIQTAEKPSQVIYDSPPTEPPSQIIDDSPQSVRESLVENFTLIPDVLQPALDRLRTFGLQYHGLGIIIDGPMQQLYLVRGDGVVEKIYSISTGRNGFHTGLKSRGTPPGMHRIRAKRGGGLASGIILARGQSTGYAIEVYRTQWVPDRAYVVTRALYLEGLEDQNTELRGIAIHGTNHEGSVLYPRIGRDGIRRGRSNGCVRMLNEDVVELFDRVPEGALVEIHNDNV